MLCYTCHIYSNNDTLFHMVDVQEGEGLRLYDSIIEYNLLEWSSVLCVMGNFHAHNCTFRNNLA